MHIEMHLHQHHSNNKLLCYVPLKLNMVLLLWCERDNVTIDLIILMGLVDRPTAEL